MINAISSLQLNKLSNINPLGQKIVNKQNAIPKNVATQKTEGLSAIEYAKLFKASKAKNIPSQNKIFNAFYSGKLDPRKLGNIVRKYKDGELHIRVVKNPETGKKDCVSVHYVKQEDFYVCGMHFSRDIDITFTHTFQEYDQMIAENKKKKENKNIYFRTQNEIFEGG